MSSGIARADGDAFEDKWLRTEAPHREEPFFMVRPAGRHPWEVAGPATPPLLSF